MLKILLSICALAVSVSSGFAAETISQRAAAKEMAKYTKTDQFEQCIRNQDIKNTVVIDDYNIIFEMKNNKYLLNTFNSKCGRLAFDKQFSFAYSNNKLCKSNFVETTQESCILSEFQVLNKLPRDS